jgi:hypothetical protein
MTANALSETEIMNPDPRGWPRQPDSSEVIPIDTLHLFTDDFSWNENKTGWDKAMRYRREKPYPQEVAYITAQKQDHLTGWHVTMWKRMLRIAGSLPRLKYLRSNINPLSMADFHLLPEYLLAFQDELGLSFNIEKLRIGRIDIFRNLEVEYSSALVVGPLSSILDVGNMRQRAKPDLYNSPYVRWGNADRQLT